MASERSADESALYLRPAAAGQGDAWTEETARRGHVGSQRLLHVGEVPAPIRVADGLNIEPGAPVVLRQRLVLRDGDPVELTDSYYPMSIAGGTALAEPRKIKGGAVSLLAHLGHQGATAWENVTARPPTVTECEVLEIEPAAWVLDVYRVVADAQAQPIEVTTMIMPARGRTLHYTIEIG